VLQTDPLPAGLAQWASRLGLGTSGDLPYGLSAAEASAVTNDALDASVTLLHLELVARIRETIPGLTADEAELLAKLTTRHMQEAAAVIVATVEPGIRYLQPVLRAARSHGAHDPELATALAAFDAARRTG
jgi:hypothetical protein